MPDNQYEFLLKHTQHTDLNVHRDDEPNAVRTTGFHCERLHGHLVVDASVEAQYSFEPPGLQLVLMSSELSMAKAFAIACDIAFNLARHVDSSIEVFSLEAPDSFDHDLPPGRVIVPSTSVLKPSLEHFMEAMKNMFDEINSVPCDTCGAPIFFSPISDGADAIRHHCPCGRYTGTLRR